MNTKTLRISTINVNGICETGKRCKVLALLRDCEADIILVQETHSISLNDWEGISHCAYLSNYSAGAAILFKKNFSGSVNPIYIYDDGRIVAVDVDFFGNKLRILSVYAPNVPADRKFFFSNLSDHLSMSRHNIVGGDFNCVDSIELDTFNHSDSSSSLQGSQELRSSMADFGLVDSFRILNPDLKKFTWFGHQATQASRLDRFFVPQQLLKGYDSEFFPYSDHKLVHCTLMIESTSGNNHGKSYWKINNNILKDKFFVEKIENLLLESRTLRPAFTSTGNWWDNVKNRIKKVAIKHSSVRKREKEEIKSKLKMSMENTSIPSEIHKLKSQLKDITDEELKSLAVRARVDSALYDEKCSSFFFNKIRKRRNKNGVSSIQDEFNNLKTAPKDILKVFHKFYEDLYSDFPGNPIAQREILGSLRPSASGENSEDTLLFSLQTIKEGLQDMAGNKTPGPDGLSVEFYKTFFHCISDILLELFQEVSEGSIPASMTEAVTVLIPKDGDKTLPSNYRPISLLNVDYKLMTRSLNKSFFTDFLKSNISPEQLCAVSGRNIRDGTLLIRDVISFCRSKSIPAAIMSLDQKKAFDMVNRNFLNEILRTLKIDKKSYEVFGDHL